MHEIAAAIVRADPVAARESGVPDPRTGGPTLDLPSTDGERHADVLKDLYSKAGKSQGLPGTLHWVEEKCVKAELVMRSFDLEVSRPWARAPYWYVEALGGALGAVDPAQLGGADRASAYLDLLRAAPRFVREGRAQLLGAEVPALWAKMAVPAAEGLARTVAKGLPGSAASLPGTAATEERDLRRALAQEMEEFVTHCRMLGTEGTGTWSVGKTSFDRLLHGYHYLDMEAEDVWEHGWEAANRDEALLVTTARQLDPDRTWVEQIEDLKNVRTPAAEFLSAYRSETEHALQVTLDHDLLTVPSGQECVVAPLPDYRRAGLPLGEMRTVAPYAGDLKSYFLITPADLTASEDRLLQHERDNCPTFVRSIVGHETYPGHHLQSVHHLLHTNEGSFLRFFRTPLFVEGWGLYVEDVLREQVFGIGGQALYALRNRLWRSLRLVIDTGLHTGKLTYPEAVELLMSRTGMDRHMASGEVSRYTRHDNPTYPSTYVLGRDLFHALAERLRAGGLPLGRVHDAMLRYGSPPLPLLENVLTKADA